jgi:hypothetical protein
VIEVGDFGGQKQSPTYLVGDMKCGLVGLNYNNSSPFAR